MPTRRDLFKQAGAAAALAALSPVAARRPGPEAHAHHRLPVDARRRSTRTSSARC